MVQESLSKNPSRTVGNPIIKKGIMPEFILKRVYEKPTPQDGYRILVDRLWPRGISKEAAQIREWNKNLAPSTELRKWFHAHREEWEAFASRFRKELGSEPYAGEFLARMAGEKRVCLVYASKDEKHCHPLVLKSYLEERNKE